MARVVVLGAGISGHTAALHLRRMLGRGHEVVVVSPNSKWNWIPSNIWVGVGKMTAEQVTFPLAPIYRRKGIVFHQALATESTPRARTSDAHALRDLRYTDPARSGRGGDAHLRLPDQRHGTQVELRRDPGPGPGRQHGVGVHAGARGPGVPALRRGHRARSAPASASVWSWASGTARAPAKGRRSSTASTSSTSCAWPACANSPTSTYLTNEYELGDFGVGGMTFTQNGFETTSELWTESLFRERGVAAVVQAHVEKVEPGVIFYEQLDGSRSTLEFDFAMLLPPFRGADLAAFDASGADITAEVFAPIGFMKVDADYRAKPYEEWSAEDWPHTYESPRCPNVFAVGIAFAPPHQISRPRASANGTVITPSPPRTGMPSGVMGKTVALTMRDRITRGSGAAAHRASMASMGAACVASSGIGLRRGTAASMTMYPIVPDYGRFPATGRSAKDTFGEIGLAGHWIKFMLHVLFIYKAKARPLWHLIPE